MRLIAGVLLSLLLCGTSFAEVVTVTVGTANIRSSPSPESSYVILEAPRNYPLSVQDRKDGFLEVQDFLGRRGWIDQSLVDANTRGVVVEVASMNVRKGPGTNFPVVFRAERGVAFQVIGEKDDWLHVRHEGGQTGWVFRSLTWGQ